MPSRSAVLGLISTQLDHIAVVSTSGNSCSQGRFAREPSPNDCETYGRKQKGKSLTAPLNSGADAAIGTRLAAAEALTELFDPVADAVPGASDQIPWACSAAQKSSSVFASIEPPRARSGTYAALSMAS